MHLHTILRPCLALVLSVGAAASFGCGPGKYDGPAEDLVMPRVKPMPEKPVAKPTGPTEPDTCKYNFDNPPVAVATKGKHDSAKGLANDADNTLSGAATANWQQRRNMVITAISQLNDALKADPYSPAATYEMAAAYAVGGKKKCMIAMLTRLNDIGAIPELAAEVAKLKQKIKTDASFDDFRKEAESVQ
jgi:hypothetical protein